MTITIKEAKVKKIIYYNNQNQWGCFAISYTPEGQTGPLKTGLETTVAGNFEGIYEGCKLELIAEEVEHPKYGKQLQLQHYRVFEDSSSKESIINFLTKSSINGIHKALAQKIYDKFGNDSIDVVLHQTEKLKEVNGIGEKTYEVVKKSVSTYFEMEELLKYCTEIYLKKFALIVQLYK